jgi:hypothetical protein
MSVRLDDVALDASRPGQGDRYNRWARDESGTPSLCFGVPLYERRTTGIGSRRLFRNGQARVPVIGSGRHGQRHLSRKDAGTAKTVACLACSIGARSPIPGTIRPPCRPGSLIDRVAQAQRKAGLAQHFAFLWTALLVSRVRPWLRQAFRGQRKRCEHDQQGNTNPRAMDRPLGRQTLEPTAGPYRTGTKTRSARVVENTMRSIRAMKLPSGTIPTPIFSGMMRLSVELSRLSPIMK